MSEIVGPLLDIVPDRRAVLEDISFEPERLHASVRHAIGMQDQLREAARRREADLRRRIDGMRTLPGAKDEIATLEERLGAEQASNKSALALAAKRTAIVEEPWRSAIRIRQSVFDYLTNVRRNEATLRYVPEKLERIRDFKGALSEVSGRRQTILAKLIELEEALTDPAELRAAITASVHSIAKAGAPSLNLRSRSGDPANLQRLLQPTVSNGDQVYSAGDGGASFLVWVHADKIIERLHALVDRADLAAALTTAERDRLLKVHTADLHRAERREEAIIEAAAQAGIMLARREDMSPAAVLLVAEVR